MSQLGGFEEQMADCTPQRPADPASAVRAPTAPVVPYHSGQRRLQDRFDTRLYADRISERAAKTAIDARARAFIESVDMFFIATADSTGRMNCSYKGGDPGFVRVVDEATIAFPIYDGNGMFVSAGNLLVNAEVGILFISFEEQRRLRLNGTASVDEDDPLLPQYAEAQLIVRVHVRELFPNCSRYIHRYRLEESSRFVPRRDRRTPVPTWKRVRPIVDRLPDRLYRSLRDIRRKLTSTRGE